MEYKVWKFHDFSVTQILREINFGVSKRSKNAVFVILLGSDFSFLWQITALKSSKIHQNQNV